MQQPKTWTECAALINDPELHTVLRVRLFELAMSQTSAVATRAIEMLLGAPQDADAHDLRDVPTAQLERAKARAEELIRTMLEDEEAL